ncbi:MAG: adenylate kinase [Acidimicrobiales bacterium]
MSETPTTVPVGRRVIVTGLAGAGKSTFSRALSAKTGLPLVVLDIHYWKPGWVKPTEDGWRATQRRLLAGDVWIADGNYDESLDLRLERADTIVFLATSWWICAWRAIGRGIRTRPAGFELPEGCEESRWRRWRDEWWLALRIVRARRSEPERERAIVARHGQHVAVYVLSSQREVRAFLDA